jgi:hypothetical protein
MNTRDEAISLFKGYQAGDSGPCWLSKVWLEYFFGGVAAKTVGVENRPGS